MLSRRAFRAFARAFPEPLLLVAASGEILSVNGPAARLLGYPEPPPEGLTLQAISAPDGPPAERLLRQLGRTSAPLPAALTIVDREGREHGCRIQGSVVEHHPDGRALLLLRLQPRAGAAEQLATFSHQVEKLEREIARRRQAELVLEGQKRLLDMIGGSEPLGAILFAVTRFVEEHSAHALCAVLLAQERGRRLRLGAAPSLPDGYRREVDGIEPAAQDEAPGAAATHPHDSAHRRVAERHGLRTSWLTPVRDRTGELLAAVAMLYRDAALPTKTDLFLGDLAVDLVSIALTRERTDAALRRRATELAEADSRKDRFLAMLSHELRNPLAPIVNTLEALRERSSGDPELTASVERLRRQTGHLSRLVDDLLDISRIAHGVVELHVGTLDLGRVVQLAVDSTRELFEERGQTLLVPPCDEPLWVDGDAARLQQVFSNLLTNAAKYTHDGGRIEVEIESDGERAVVRVRDDGQGLTDEVASRLFEPFTQGAASALDAREGLGLGLTLAKQLVECHRGTIEAESSGPGRGSEFTVTLPLADAPQPEPGEEPPSSHAEASLDVLVVEDNHDSAEAMGVLLELWGHRPRIVYDGEAALEAALEQTPDVILLDIDLPGRNGYEVARELGRSGVTANGCLLIAMTGFGRQQDIDKSRAAGFREHLIKPAEPARVRQLLADFAAHR